MYLLSPVFGMGFFGQGNRRQINVFGKFMHTYISELHIISQLIELCTFPAYWRVTR